MIKTTVGIPTNRGLRPKMAQALLNLVAKGGYDFHIVVAEEGYTVAENRNYLAVQALNNNSEYLLMIDDDMVFNPDLLDRLIANDKDICGVAYQPRNETAKATKYLDATHAVVLDEHADDPEFKKVRECYATGTGIILIKTEVFKKVPRPWFAFETYDTGQISQGEDWNFCIKAGKHGIKTNFDPTVYVGHLGEKIYQRKIWDK